jgi:hypothetical protein
MMGDQIENWQRRLAGLANRDGEPESCLRSKVEAFQEGKNNQQDAGLS